MPNPRFINTLYLTTIIVLSSFSVVTNAFSSAPHAMATPMLKQDSTVLNMQGPGRNEENENPISLSAYTTELLDYDEINGTSMQTTTISNSNTAAAIPEPSLLDSFIIPVFTASLMVTGNTVGAGMLVLPEVVANPGPMLSFGVMIGAWIMCLTSGLTIAQVAIQEHESSGTEVPSSFKEFAESTLPSAANLVSGTSIFINTLISAFDVSKAGHIIGTCVLPPALAVDETFLSYAYSALLVGLVSTQSLKNLSQVASFLVFGLFASFAGLLLPGLANVIDPTSVLSMPPLLPSEEVGDGVLVMTPVVISVLVFQNIVPTITRLLEYDRLKVVTTLVIGSFIPLLMYIAWAIAVLGGGVDTSSASGSSLGLLMICFSLATVTGSSLGSAMSLSEEFEIYLRSDPKDGDENEKKIKDATFSLPSVALPVGIALVLAQIFSSDITETIKVAGAFGSPILYGFIPVAMALRQQQRGNKDGAFGTVSETEIENGQNSIIPGGVVGLGALTLASGGLIGTELIHGF